MAFVVADRVAEITVTTGTGAVTMAGASAGYQTWLAGIGNGNSSYYTIASDTQWEVGIGTYNSGTNTLTRDSVISSSNAGALVNFSAGTKNVMCTGPASGVSLGRTGMTLHKQTIDVDVVIPAGYNAVSAGPVSIATGKTVTIPTGSVWSIT
jgi:hypothetical protein